MRSFQAIIGRERELSVIGSWLAQPASGVFVIEGEAGIGKSTLWEAGVHTARERGSRVLAARPGEAEAQLSFCALGDLLASILDDVLLALPEPQERALAIALRKREAGADAPDPGTLAVALTNGLRAQSAQCSLLVAVDDVQWLDPASAAALSFAIPRVAREDVRFLLSWRTREDDHIPLGLDRRMTDELLAHMRVGPLSMGAIHRLLHERLGLSLDRPTLRRLVDVSGGNPFFALELGRVVERLRAPLWSQAELLVPPSLDELVGNRLRALPRVTQLGLAAVAALADPQIRFLDSDADLDPAVTAHVVELVGGRVRFTHPLFASAAYGLLTPARRRELHRALAEAVEDQEERARHLALAAVKADDAIIAALEQAATTARERGAPRAAGDFLLHARRLTPAADREAGARRSIEAARCCLAAGDASTARRVLAEVIAMLEPGRVRAEALHLAAEAESSTGRALELCDRALGEAEDHPRLLARILEQRSELDWNRDDLRQARSDADAALAVAESAGDPATLAAVLTHAGATAVITGDASAAQLLQRAQQLFDQGLLREAWRSPEHWRGFRHVLRDELEQARPLLLSAYARAAELGDDFDRGALCLHLTQLELRAGAWDEARRYAEELDDLYLASGLQQARSMPLAARALVAAHVGDEGVARGLAAEGLKAIGEVGDSFFLMHFSVALGSLALSLGDYPDAVEQLRGLPGRLERIGVGEPAMFPFQADLVEAHVGLGELDEAGARLDALERQARLHPRPRFRAWASRCRGLLLAGRGDAAGAVAELEAALAAHAALPIPFERARTLLALGIARRRAKRKRPAREALEDALIIFEQLGARLWAERVQAELARIGGRTENRDDLTPTERRVAELVAGGRTNKEAAAALSVSVRAIEANLSRIYLKLGIRSRSQLARALSRDNLSSKV
jgi:DNA-binding CsgD family transcriptional regulator